MNIPIDVSKLPGALAKHARAAQKRGLWSKAIDAFEDWLDDKGERPPAVLVMLAYMVFQDAIELMVDEVEKRGERALALLDEARLSKQTAALRREIARAVELARKRTRAEAKRVATSSARPLESLSLRDLRELAYKLGESKAREDQATAARAWLLAAEREEEPFDRNDCLGRAALSFADAGDWQEARPRLEHIVKHPREYEDWISEFAWYRMLDKAIAAGDVAGFKKRWSAAVKMPREDHFPYANPSQEAYLRFAVEHELAGVAKHVAAIIVEHRSARDRKALQLLLARAAKL